MLVFFSKSDANKLSSVTPIIIIVFLWEFCDQSFNVIFHHRKEYIWEPRGESNIADHMNQRKKSFWVVYPNNAEVYD